MTQGIARWGGEFIVGSGAALDAPSVAGLGPNGGVTGRFVVVYGQSTTDVARIGDTQGIVGQLYNADGSKHGGPFRINNNIAAEQYAPVVIDRVDGEGFAVAWSDNTRKANNWGTDVRMRLFDFDGAADLGGSFVIHNSTEFDNEAQPSIDRIGTTGSIFVAYDNQVGSPSEGMGVYGRVFSNATPISSNLPIAPFVKPGDATNTEGQPTVTDIPTTGFLVVYTDSIDAGQIFGSGTAIRGRLYSQTGTALAGEFDIASIAGFNLRDPTAAGFADGSFIVGWTQDDDPGGAFDRNLYARIFSPEGVGGTPFLVHQNAAGQQLNLVLTPFGPDKVIAVWQQQTSTNSNIAVRIFNDDGTPFSDEMIVENNAPGHSSVLPAVTVLQEGANGRFVVTWRNNSTTEIRGQIFDVAQGAAGIDFYGSERAEAYTARTYNNALYTDEHVLYGNGGNDTLTGTAQADTLNGGTGADRLVGAAGDDTYVNPTAVDTLVEAAGPAGGHDTVRSNASFDLGGAANVEDLVLTGSAAITGSGNDAGNRITGNDAANTLIGRGGNDTLLGGGGNDTLNGGAGPDTLRGGAGDDLYANPVQGGAEGDTIIDDANAGIDTVQSNGSFSLAALANTENVTLTGGSAANATGNALANTLTGNGGVNILSGLGGNDTLAGGGGKDVLIGGEGNDRMDGGALADTFRFAAANTGADRITGFETALDRFDLAGGTFTARSHSDGNTVLTHAGGTVTIVGIVGLTLAQWNAMVLPAGGAASDGAALSQPAFDGMTWPELDALLGLSRDFAVFGHTGLTFL